MFKKDNFFKSYFTKSREHKKNIEKTKKIFKSVKIDIENYKIPLLSSYDKEYDSDFSKNTVKKFSKYKNIIIIGMGGSILGIKSIHSFFYKKIKKNVFFLDNLDSDLYSKFKKIKNLNNSCFILISKSGNTLETLANFNFIFSKILTRKKLIIITEMKNNTLMNIANKYEAEIIEHKEFISGRYSVLSEPGMFPATLMGLDPIKFKNLKRLIKDKIFVSSLIQNVAGIFTLNLKGLRNSVIFNYDSSLNDLGYWYQQLVAESLGKKGKGVNPSLSFGPKDHHSLLQLYLDGPKDKFFTFFTSINTNEKHKVKKNIFPENMNFLKNKELKSIINSQCTAVKRIFKLKGIPYREIIFKKRNEEELGYAFTFFVLETIILSRLMNVNPFDQPEVEQVKIETKKILR